MASATAPETDGAPDGNTVSARGVPAAGPPSVARALAEVVVCSGLVTQVALLGGLTLVGMRPELSLRYLATLSLLDTALLLVLIAVFLRSSGDAPRDVLLGRRPRWREGLVGVLLTPVVFAIVVAVGSAVLQFAPWLHNVERNPLEAMITSLGDALLFGVVAIVAGGVREECQRAFILTRFRQSLGGIPLGILLSSVAFGAGHLVQGHDAAIVTGALGALWAVVYARRGSVLAPLVSHAAFNCVEVFRFGLS